MTKTKKIKVWAAINSKGHVSIGLKRKEVVNDLAATSKGFDPDKHRVVVHKFEHEVEVPEKKVKKAKAASRNGAKPKAKKTAAKKKAPKKKAKDKRKKKAKKMKAADASPPSMPW